MPEIQISSITFLDVNVLQIQYSEQREYSDKAALMRSLVIDTDALVEGEIQDLTEIVLDIIDKGLLIIRNPPAVIEPTVIEREED